MKGCDIFCICHERQSILATIQPASQAGLCGFFKVALLKKKTKLLLIYLHTHTHTQNCSTFTLEPAVAPEGSSPFDLEFKGLGALATSLCKIRLSQLFFAAYSHSCDKHTHTYTSCSRQCILRWFSVDVLSRETYGS